MYKSIRNLFLVVLLLFSTSIVGQTTTDTIAQNAVSDTTLSAKKNIRARKAPQVITNIDTVIVKKDSVKKVDSNNIVWMGAIIPGYGQILNQKYWKLPIVYGGFLVCVYAITWNGGRYSTYKTAYRDMLSNNPNATSYLDILPKNVTIEQMGGWSTYQATLKTRQDMFRRYRDLSIFLSVAYYGITILDAYVDAQLFDFDISTDLSMSIRPSIQDNSNPWTKVNNSYGMRISFNLK